MGKGEIARYEQFLLFPQCFQKACFPGASKGVIVWDLVKWYLWGWGGYKGITTANFNQAIEYTGYTILTIILKEVHQMADISNLGFYSLSVDYVSCLLHKLVCLFIHVTLLQSSKRVFMGHVIQAFEGGCIFTYKAYTLSEEKTDSNYIKAENAGY